MSSTLEEIFAWMEEGNPPPNDAGLFGATIPWDLANIHVIGAPWDATTSYGAGTSQGPAAVLQASHQLDLEDQVFGQAYRAGIAFKNLVGLSASNEAARQLAEQVIAQWEDGQAPSANLLDTVNEFSLDAHFLISETIRESLIQGQRVGLLGGDHSTSYGSIQAHAQMNPEFGILHIDAHHDLRVAYEGFTHSHASIMYNVMETIPQVTQLVSVGIRDFSTQEKQYAKQHPERIVTFYDEELFNEKACGVPYHRLVDEMLAPLPDAIYISLDIDGLSPEFGPNTGTPVPGGLSYSEVAYILRRIKDSRHTLIGFDLVEVAPGESEWDANVGARLLYKLCGLLGYTNQLY